MVEKALRFRPLVGLDEHGWNWLTFNNNPLAFKWHDYNQHCWPSYMVGCLCNGFYIGSVEDLPQSVEYPVQSILIPENKTE